MVKFIEIEQVAVMVKDRLAEVFPETDFTIKVCPASSPDNPVKGLLVRWSGHPVNDAVQEVVGFFEGQAWDFDFGKPMPRTREIGRDRVRFDCDFIIANRQSLDLT